MAITIKHAKTDTIADWTQTDLDAQIALGNFPPGTLLADIVLPSDWNNDHTISGTVPIANGGTGQTTANAAINALLPSQSSQSGKVLSTDGTNTSWVAAGGTGTVTSVSGVSPVSVATGTTTPVISMPAATASVNGYLTSTDWTTFNNKAPATSGTSILYGNGSGGFSNVTIGTNLTFTGGTLNATAGGTGDVVGPASATDNAITRFDGTTGKLIQNSTVTLSDTGALSGVNSIVTPDYITYDTTATGVTITPGVTTWNDGEGTLDLGLKGGNVTLNVGTQEYARVYNDSGTTLTKGQVVYISGAQGNRVAVKLARADVEATSFGTIGLVAETITSGSEGFIIVSGALYKLNTTGLVAGATVYLSPTTAGALTTTKPQAPNQLVVLGWVERVDNTVGSIYVKIDNGYELEELHDVQIISPTSGNLLIYDATTSPIGVWKNANLTAGTGISISNGAGSITVTNSAPDQTVAITGTSPVSVTGTYPNFTVSMTQSSTSTNGWLSSTDWNTFNSKAPATSGTSILYGNGSGGFSNVTVGTGLTFSAGTLSASGGAGVTSFQTSLSGLTPSTASTGVVTLAGTLGIGSGGTGQTTATTAFNALAPSQTSNTGKFLKTDGTNTSWSTLPSKLIVLLHSGTSTADVPVANGVLPILTNGGSTINVAVS
jgi:hypothetical protein